MTSTRSSYRTALNRTFSRKAIETLLDVIHVHVDAFLSIEHSAERQLRPMQIPTPIPAIRPALNRTFSRKAIETHDWQPPRPTRSRSPLNRTFSRKAIETRYSGSESMRSLCALSIEHSAERQLRLTPSTKRSLRLGATLNRTFSRKAIETPT